MAGSRTWTGSGLPLGSDPPCSAPPAASVPQAECRLVEVHGRQVASFRSGGSDLLCLPQVFQLFLRQLVGGLHTVYTKLKRLRLSPVVCTVEQVRVLRGLGAIQPGVNRCKLISRPDFETLYRDCTSASSRPGRPPKRSLGMAAMTDGSRLLPHRLISPALLSQTGLTAVYEALKLQKMRMMMSYHGDLKNDNTAGGSEASWEKDPLSSRPPVGAPPAGLPSVNLSTLPQRGSLLANRLADLPFMVTPHPVLPVGLPPARIAMALKQMSQLNGFANMAALSQMDNSSKGSLPGSPAHSLLSSEEELHTQELSSQSPSRASSSHSASPSTPTHMPELGNRLVPLPLFTPTYEKMSPTSPSLSITHSTLAPLQLAEGLSSTETLLTNIQGLLKVAAESARCQHTHSQQEKKDLKVELERERDARQTLQRHLSSQMQATASIQKRLRKEKKLKKRLQEALEVEWRRREGVQRALKHSLAGAVIPENHHENQQEN